MTTTPAPEHLQQLLTLLETKYPKLVHSLEPTGHGKWNVETTDPATGETLIAVSPSVIPEERQLKWVRAHVKRLREGFKKD